MRPDYTGYMTRVLKCLDSTCILGFLYFKNKKAAVFLLNWKYDIHLEAWARSGSTRWRCAPLLLVEQKVKSFSVVDDDVW